jgi:hypothetical protein
MTIDDPAELREQLRREKARADRLEAELADTRLLLDSLRNSTLWRSLEPVRRLGSRLVALRRLVRSLRLRRAARLIRGSGLFDAAWYRTQVPELGRGDPVLHYLTHGAAAGRNPGPGFDTLYYRDRNPDAAGLNPLVHYLTIGRAEGRLPRPGLAAGPVADAPQVAFVSGDPASASEVYRVLHPLAFLNQAGITAEAAPQSDLARVAARFAAARVLVLFRTPWTAALDSLVERARQAGALVVYDVDDLVFEPEFGTLQHVDGLRLLEPQDRPAYRERLHHNRRALELADLCILSTEALAERARRLGKPALVLANGADAAMVAAAEAARLRSRPDDGRIRLGYASGTLTHQRDLVAAVPALARVLAARPEITLTLLGKVLPTEFPQLAPFADRIELRPAVPHDRLFEELVRFDVNLAPLELGNPFCDAKSELKFLHAALLGIPTIASPTPPFQAAIEHGRTGLLAADDAAWDAALDRLAGDAGLRRAMGAAAQAAALASYGPAAKAETTVALYRRLMDGKE